MIEAYKLGRTTSLVVVACGALGWLAGGAAIEAPAATSVVSADHYDSEAATLHRAQQVDQEPVSSPSTTLVPSSVTGGESRYSDRADIDLSKLVWTIFGGAGVLVAVGAVASRLRSR